MTTKRNIYPMLILLLFGSFLGFSTWAAMRAVESNPQVTDVDYYSNGLKYSSTLLEKRTATVLGWTVATQQEGRSLAFYLNDKEGRPVRTAKGSILFYLPKAGGSVRFPLQQVSEGVYLLNLTDSMTGEMSARLEFESAGARLNRQLLLNL